jgi:hypothetical protein
MGVVDVRERQKRSAVSQIEMEAEGPLRRCVGCEKLHERVLV